MRPESYRIWWNYARQPPLRRSRSFKVTDFGTNRKLICDFLLVINTNLYDILHRFRDIAFERSKIAIFGYPLGFNPPTRGFPWDDLRKIFIQRMAKVPHGVETLPKMSQRYRRQTTDRRQTDGRWHIANVNASSRLLKTQCLRRLIVWSLW